MLEDPAHDGSVGDEGDEAALATAPGAGEHVDPEDAVLAALKEALRAKKLRQVEAAVWLGVRQPRMSQLLQGRIDLFSSDALIELLARAGVSVRFGALTGGRPV